jgi:hypothetical protein
MGTDEEEFKGKKKEGKRKELEDFLSNTLVKDKFYNI